MTHSFKILFLFIVVLITVVSAGRVEAATASKQAQPKYTRIFYYRDSERALVSFLENIKSIDVLAPQSYTFNTSGTLSGSVDPYLISVAKRHNVKLMPLVTNGNFSESSLRALLDDPAKQDKAADALVAEALKYGYWGWQIDFEQIRLPDRDAFSAFIDRLGKVMKEHDLVLSVAVIAQVSDIPSDYPRNLWERLIGAYDYAALASSTDFISIMSYDDPESKGPVARYSWMKQAIAHSLKYIPSEKLSLGIPLYYWKWNETTGKLVGIGGYEGIENTLKKYKVAKSFSTKHQVPYLTYTVNKTPYIIWYENAKSIQQKLALITTNELHGFSAWVLGLETPDIHNVLMR